MLIALGTTLGNPGLLIPFALVQVVVFLGIVYALDVYEHEPVALVGLVALVGGILGPIAVLEIRPHLQSLLHVTSDRGQVVLSAAVEEPAKGLVLVLLVIGSRALASRLGEAEFDGVTDGIVYGAAAGIGFAFTENLFYLTQSPNLGQGLTVFTQRTDFFGIELASHAVYSALFGAGLGLATWSKPGVARVAYPLFGLLAGFLMHATHNVLAVSSSIRTVRLVDYAYLVVALALVVVWLDRQRCAIEQVLRAERTAGLPLSAKQLELASSYPAFVKHQWQALKDADPQRRADTAELRAALVQLAFSQWRASFAGGDPGLSAGSRATARRLLAPA